MPESQKRNQRQATVARGVVLNLIKDTLVGNPQGQVALDAIHAVVTYATWKELWDTFPDLQQLYPEAPE